MVGPCYVTAADLRGRISAFDRCARQYGSARPDYPEDIVVAIRRQLRLRKSARVADVGAGTGIATRLLHRHGLGVIPIELSLSMIREGGGCRLRFVAARAEHLPLINGCVDAVISAQAFHWFDPSRALVEFHRVIRRGGGIAIFWNNRSSRHHPFVEDYENLVIRYNPRHRRDPRARLRWGRVLTKLGLFTDVRHTRFPHQVLFTRRRFLTYSRSVSYVRNVLTPFRLKRFLQEVDALWHRHFSSTSGLIDYETDLWTARKA